MVAEGSVGSRRCSRGTFGTGRDTPEVSAGPPKASNFWHKAASAPRGAVGGAFGLAAIAIELPISTTIMMRSIADIARSGGGEPVRSRHTGCMCRGPRIWRQKQE
ncbi:EcsC family protein [Caballeronia telluris]|uniref:EcsC family protein n=1 Tax=Caballeronia telluris TaxID=326475 RepID=UPI000B3E7EB8